MSNLAELGAVFEWVQGLVEIAFLLQFGEEVFDWHGLVRLVRLVFAEAADDGSILAFIIDADA